MWNLVGYFVPMVAAVVAIPRLLDGLGVARFGVLSLAWIVTGYFGFFDFGIGRALTKMVADKLGSHDEDAMAPLVWTALLLLLALGVFGALAMLALSAWFIHRVLHMPTMLQAETLHGF